MKAFVFGCTLLIACEANQVPDYYVDAARERITTRQGITYRGDMPFSGWVYQLSASGDTMALTPYLRGKEEGMAQRWYANGQLSEQRFYHQGKKESEHRGWYANGRRRFLYHYKNDLYDGNVKEWQADGRPYRNFNYAMGYEAGRQQMWESDGRLKANYDVRDGRKYGLTGSKNCQSAAQ